MIPGKVCVDFKSATKKERQEIGEIMIANYTKLINAMIKEADYGTITAYWKDFTPLSRKIIKAKDFIKKYGKSK